MHAARVVGELDGEAQHVERPVHRMVDRDLHLLVTDLRIVEYFRQAHHAAARHACGVQHVDPVLDRLLADPRVDDRVDRRAPLEALGIGAEFGMVAQVRQTERVEELEIDLSLDGAIATCPSFASNRPYGATSAWSLPVRSGCSPVSK